MLTYPNAKINIGLNIVEKRPDGYHNIETVFYPIALYDKLKVEICDSCDDYNFNTAGIAIDAHPEDNLIVKAYRLLQKDFHLPSVDISLDKTIPFGAGLGGGSADAAFMLKALNEIAHLNLTDEQLEAYAVRLGADCPVFIRNKPVFASGIGNIFEQVDLSLAGYYFALVKPDIAVSTPAAYAQVRPQKPQKSLRDLIKLPLEQWKEEIFNDFEKSVFPQYPRIAQIKQELYEAGAIYASMSGSGSSVFGLFSQRVDLSAKFSGCFIAGGDLL